MKSIKFTEQELEFLRKQYQLELVEAEKYVQEVKNLLVKLGVKPATTESVPEKKSRRGRKKTESPKESPVKKGKRGRKPKEQVPAKSTELSVSKPEKKSKEKTPKSRKGKSLKVIPVPIIESINPEPPIKKEVPKKKPSRKSSYKRKGIILKNLSKPLPKKDIQDSLPDIESQNTDKQ